MQDNPFQKRCQRKMTALEQREPSLFPPHHRWPRFVSGTPLAIHARKTPTTATPASSLEVESRMQDETNYELESRLKDEADRFAREYDGYEVYVVLDRAHIMQV